jgi:hypothetical protein
MSTIGETVNAPASVSEVMGEGIQADVVIRRQAVEEDDRVRMDFAAAGIAIWRCAVKMVGLKARRNGPANASLSFGSEAERGENKKSVSKHGEGY